MFQLQKAGSPAFPPAPASAEPPSVSASAILCFLIPTCSGGNPGMPGWQSDSLSFYAIACILIESGREKNPNHIQKPESSTLDPPSPKQQTVK